MRISGWSSDVCSSDLCVKQIVAEEVAGGDERHAKTATEQGSAVGDQLEGLATLVPGSRQIEKYNLADQYRGLGVQTGQFACQPPQSGFGRAQQRTGERSEERRGGTRGVSAWQS